MLGGFGPGAAAGRPELTRFGFVELHFAFPGGGRGEARSGGSYDFRGPRSIRALADVIRFATGRLRDKEGRSLDELIPGNVRIYVDLTDFEEGTYQLEPAVEINIQNVLVQSLLPKTIEVVISPLTADAS